MSTETLIQQVVEKLTDVLVRVPWLQAGSELARAEVLARSKQVRLQRGRRFIVELEAGDDLFILLEGTATVTVGDGHAESREVAELGPGDVCGELSLLTQEVRSASVTAKTPIRALRMSRAAFLAVCERHPAIAAEFARTVAERIAETRARLMAIAHPPPAQASTVRLALPPRATVRRTVRRLWREVAINHGLELPALALFAFTAAVLLLRACVSLLDLRERELLSFLRVAYTSGFVLVFVATGVSLLRFRRRVQRWVATGLGLGLGAIVNGLSVFLAFDLFYLDMTRRDTALPFSVDLLYQRDESEWAMAAVIVLLLQLLFLRRFYHRLWLVLRLRLPHRAG